MRVHFIVWTQRTGLQQKRNAGVPVRQRSIRLEPERAPGKRNGAPTGGGAPLEPSCPVWPSRPKASQVLCRSSSPREARLALGGGVGFGVFLEEIERSRFFSGELGSFRNFLDRNRSGHFRQQLNVAVMLEARAGRNEPAHDDVFLEAAEIVHLAGNGRFGKHARGFLEARGGDKRIRRERRLGDAQEQRAARSRTTAALDGFVVLLAEAELVHLLFEEEVSVANVFNLDPAHHLARDHFDVLVVDVDALEAVDLLNGVDQISLGELLAENGEQVMKVERTVNQCLASLDVIAFLHVDVHAARDGVFLGGLAILGLDVDLAHALGDFAVADDAVNFADDCGILGLASLEQFDDARQTAGDVLGLGGFAWNLREHVAGLNIVAVAHHQVGARRHEVFLADFAGRVANQNCGLVLFIARRQSHDVLRKAGDFVDLLFNGDAGLQVIEFHRAGGFRQNREGKRIPLGENLAVGDVFTVLNAEARAVNDVVALLLAVLFVHDGDEAGAVHGDERTAATFDVLKVHELDDAVVAGFESRALGNARSGSADVERAHGELRAGLADGLRGDDADGFAKFHHAAGGQVAAVAKRANTATRFASEHRTDADAVDTRGLDGVGQLFVDFLVDVNDDVALEVLDLVERNAAHNAVAKRLDFHARLDDGFDVDAIGGTAVVLVDDHVLRHVHEAASQVAGVGGFERRVGETFARAVRGDEIFQHGEAFAEVGSDGRLDDFAGRLGHQAAHSGELANLLFRTARAGVGHDVDRVDVAFLVLAFEGLKHFVGNFFGDVAPDGDDFVVALAVGDGAVEVLLLDFDAFFFGRVNEPVFIAGNEHVIDADRDAGARGVSEAQRLEVIEQNDRVSKAEAQVGVLDELLNALLFEKPVHEREFFGQVRVEDDATDGGLDELTFHLHWLGVRHVLVIVGRGEVNDFAGVAQANWREQFHFAGFEREDDVFGGTENAAFALGAGLGLGQVIDAQNHVLRGHGERQSVRGRKNVARAEHQYGRFDLRFRRKRNVHGHLVAVKVRVERCANQRVNADGLALNERRLEGLNAEAVQRRSTVQKNGMLANHVFQDVPNDGLLLLHHFLGLLDGGAVALGFKLVIDERLEELERHFLRQTALVELEFRADDDDRTARIVHALAKKVLSEAPLLAF